ncbi:hypothetical protein C6570_02755 [Ottowia oryzae]|uniref:EamA domain-containing protein n=1 Tax=Ottowia oryzae TaxID=2109914 RepID=A0A2S0MBL0_9BURK|nr:hypothetical protein C6570_02755 [Ottowia oryzae]
MSTLTHPHSPSRQAAGFWLGVLGTACFAVTLPATRLATGTAADPQLSPLFVTLGRAAMAGLLSAAFLVVTRAAWPTARQWRLLSMSMLGNAIGYPLLLAWALRSVTATHAAVVTALLPLTTAVVAAWVLHQRARPAFWGCAVLGSALVVVFAWPLLGEQPDAVAIGFALAVVATVFVSRRLRCTQRKVIL